MSFTKIDVGAVNGRPFLFSHNTFKVNSVIKFILYNKNCRIKHSCLQKVRFLGLEKISEELSYIKTETLSKKLSKWENVYGQNEDR